MAPPLPAARRRDHDLGRDLTGAEPLDRTEQLVEPDVLRLDEHVLREPGRGQQLERAVEAVGVVAERTGDHELVQQDAVRVEPRRLDARSEEHTSELQSRRDLVCRLLLEKKKKT